MIKVIVCICVFLSIIHSVVLSITTNMVNDLLVSFSFANLIKYSVLLYFKSIVSYVILYTMFMFNKALLRYLHGFLFRKIVIDKSANSYGDMLTVLKNDSNNYISYMSLALESSGYVICFIICYLNLIKSIGFFETFILIVVFIIFYVLSKIITKHAVELQESYVQSLAQSVNALTEIFENRIWLSSKNRQRFKLKYHNILGDEISSMHKYNEYNDVAKAINSIAIIFIDISVCIIMLKNLAYDKSKVISTFIFIDIIGYQIKYLFDNINQMKPLSYSVNKIKKIQKNNRRENEKIINDFKCINFNNIYVFFDKLILNKTSLFLEKGHKYAIVGENGTGKSTLVRCLWGEVGSININVDGKEIDNIHGIATLVTSSTSLFDTSFENNVTVFGTYSFPSIDERYYYLNKKINELRTNENCLSLSGGERQLVLILRSFAMNQELLLLDEIDASLDERIQTEIHDLVLNSDKTIIMVTHSIGKGYIKSCDHILTIKNCAVTLKGVDEYD